MEGRGDTFLREVARAAVVGSATLSPWESEVLEGTWWFCSTLSCQRAFHACSTEGPLALLLPLPCFGLSLRLRLLGPGGILVVWLRLLS